MTYKQVNTNNGLKVIGIIISITKISNKVYKLSIQKKAILKPIHTYQYEKAIKKIAKSKNNCIQEYNQLIVNQNRIRLK